MSIAPNRRALVTGASTGLGRETALTFARAGYDVALADIDAGMLDPVMGVSALANINAVAVTLDLRSEDGIRDGCAAAIEALGGLDVLVNNPSGFGRTDDDEGWAKSVDIDLMPVVRGSHYAIPLIEKSGGGSIIHISTISALTESMRTPPYGAIKAAVNHYTVTQAKSLAPKGIRVNAICPGSIYFKDGVWDVAKRENRALYDSILASIPSGRYGTPEEIANVAVFLASNAGSWVTGQAIAVDGGQAL